MRLRAGWIACVAVACVGSGSASAGDRLWLVRDGRAAATIVRGGDDDFAAERLATWLADKSGAKIDVQTADAERFVDERLARLYGGREAAHAIPRIIPLVRTSKDRASPENCGAARRLAESARQAASPDGHDRWDRLIAYLERHERAAVAALEEQRRREAAARAGRKIEVASVEASDEDRRKGWLAAKAIDGSVAEPEGYWLTGRTSPKQAWLELTLAEPTRVNRVVLFHQLNPGHYRSLDYTVSVRAGRAWKPVATIAGNDQAGWVAHPFDPVLTDAVRLDVTRSAYGNRMGIGEIEVRWVEEDG